MTAAGRLRRRSSSAMPCCSRRGSRRWASPARSAGLLLKRAVAAAAARSGSGRSNSGSRRTGLAVRPSSRISPSGAGNARRPCGRIMTAPEAGSPRMCRASTRPRSEARSSSRSMAQRFCYPRPHECRPSGQIQRLLPGLPGRCPMLQQRAARERAGTQRCSQKRQISGTMKTATTKNQSRSGSPSFQ